MRRFNVKASSIALIVALLPGIANAVGLGRLTMVSALGDTLNAEIDLVSVSREEMSTLSARLASPDAYRQANLQYSSVLVGARVTIERRAGGQPFVKITSNRTLNEPFVDLMVELTSSSGRLVREYTALVDPPSAVRVPPVAAAAPAARPAPAPAAPEAAPTPAPRQPAAVRQPSAGASAAGAKQYGPVERGDNLSKIARSVMPEGVSLEQMLIGLYRSNPDAFIRNNLNLIKAGRILRVPDKAEIEAIAPAEARKEYRAQVADWNAYRQNLAGGADVARAEGRTTAAGRITTKVDDSAAGQPRDVVRLSRGEPPGTAGAKGAAGDRVRALEEELLARDKALQEANDRISQLERTIKDLQKLAELKSPGMAAAQQKAEQAAGAKPVATGPEQPATPKGDEAKTGAEPAAGPGQMARVEPAQPVAPAAPVEQQPKPAPKPAPKVVAPPPPPPSLMDQVVDAATDPVYLGAAGGLIGLGGLAFLLARRRRGRSEGTPAEEPRKAAPAIGGGVPSSTESTVTMPAMAVAAGAAAESAAASPAAAPATAVDDVDPIAEAEVYIAYGRDAQAEEILKDALARNPNREDARLKLLEIYSARKDKESFNRVATEFSQKTGGSGEKWLAAAAMGYALDPDNALYAAGKDAAAPAGAAGSPTASDLDFDLGGESTVAATDITLDSGQMAPGHDTTAILDVGELQSAAAEADRMTETAASAPLMPDFNLDFPSGEGGGGNVTQTDVPLEAVPTQDGHVIDFQIELPKVDEPDQQDRTQILDEPPVTEAGLDFKLDVPDLNLDGASAAAEPSAPAAEKDGHWYDVQTKFDLAKAYQEMGDKDGAREILQEVIREGDSEQQSQAKQLLESLA